MAWFYILSSLQKLVIYGHKLVKDGSSPRLNFWETGSAHYLFSTSFTILGWNDQGLNAAVTSGAGRGREP